MQARAQFGFDVSLLDRVLPDAIESRAGNIAAEPDLITSGRFADECDLRRVRPRAAVRAAGRADDDFFAGQSDFRANFFDAVNQSRQHAFGFREREPASGQCRTGHRGGVHDARLARPGFDAIFRQQFVNADLIFLGDVGQNNILVGRKAEFAFGKSFSDQAQRGFELPAFHVLDASGFDKQREKPFSVHSLMPAVKVARGREFARLRRRERDASALVDFVLHEFHAAFGDNVFQARVFAVGAVAEIAMNCQNGFRHFNYFIRRKKSDDVREARKSLHVAVTATHAAADGEIVTDEFFVFDNRDEADVVRENINIVDRRNGEGDFEFSRQICFAVKRVNEIFIFRRLRNSVARRQSRLNDTLSFLARAPSRLFTQSAKTCSRAFV